MATKAAPKAAVKPVSAYRAPHTADVPTVNTTKTSDSRPNAQTWDPALQRRLVEIGKKYGINEYDPVVAMAEMAMLKETDERVKFMCHKEVAKYVRLKRQMEPIVNIQQNVYQLAPAQRNDRIEELRGMIANTLDVGVAQTTIDNED